MALQNDRYGLDVFSKVPLKENAVPYTDTLLPVVQIYFFSYRWKMMGRTTRANYEYRFFFILPLSLPPFPMCRYVYVFYPVQVFKAWFCHYSETRPTKVRLSTLDRDLSCWKSLRVGKKARCTHLPVIDSGFASSERDNVCFIKSCFVDWEKRKDSYKCNNGM